MRIPPILISFFEGTEVIWLAFITCAFSLLFCRGDRAQAVRKTVLMTLLIILTLGILIGIYNIYQDGYFADLRIWPYRPIVL